jgi:hypothetical protein
MAETETKLPSFEELREKFGLVRALDTFFGGYGYLPEPKFAGEYHEALGDKDLGEDVEQYIKSNFPR